MITVYHLLCQITFCNRIPIMDNNENISKELTNKKLDYFNKFRKSFIGETIQIVIISLLIVIPFRAYIAQPFLVSGSSMDDTFANGQYLIVDELTYHINNPQRGEVVIFHYPLDTQKYFIKRVIGLPNETIEIIGDEITVYKSETDSVGIKLEEPYVKIDKLFPVSKMNSKITLKENEYYLLGDNRSHSSDSRIWGPVKRDLIAGRPILRLFPFNKIAIFPGKY